MSLGDMMASSPICLLSKASKIKSWLWHRRLSHLNFGAINHLARQGLVRGLPNLKFEKDHLCSTCAMGKSKKKSHKPKSEDTNQEKLYLLHMDLCGLMRVESVNGKKYILFIVDDYSRFIWVKFLRSKDEAPDFILKFLKMIQVRLKLPVRRIRTYNGTEFVNQTLREYYEQRLWLPHVTPKIDPFENLEKLQPKADIGIFIGYAPAKKAFWIYNRRLVPNPTSSTQFIPPTRNEWDLLFQPLFDGLLTPPSSVDPPAPKVIAPIDEVIPPEHDESTGSPSSIIVDQDALSTSKSQTTPETQPPIIPHDVKEGNHDIEVAHIGNDPLFGMPILEVAYDQSLSTALESLKKYDFESCDLVDTPMVEKSKLDEDKEGKAVDPSHYHDADHAGCQDTRRSTSGSLQFLGDRLRSWSSKRQKSAAISSTKAKYIALSKHINIIYHFIKEHVKNRVVELYFVNTEYQLADLFTKALGRERIEFLINKLGMRSFTLETLKQLTDEVDK
nr:integrase, catalytic region, zinc finger, CCHC-type, peptidase aspartic, catalytic [Tanacetum cinerariifolium]